MLSRVALVLTIAMSTAGAATQRVPASTDVAGVWRATELASRVSGAEWQARPTPYLSQYIFTATHYSYMYVPGPGPRRTIAGDQNRPTDAEKVEAYNSLVAASGTYEVSGRTLRMVALVHKNPNEMDGKPLTYTAERDGSTLRLTIANPPFLPGLEWPTVLTKVE